MQEIITKQIEQSKLQPQEEASSEKKDIEKKLQAVYVKEEVEKAQAEKIRREIIDANEKKRINLEYEKTLENQAKKITPNTSLPQHYIPPKQSKETKQQEKEQNISKNIEKKSTFEQLHWFLKFILIITILPIFIMYISGMFEKKAVNQKQENTGQGKSETASIISTPSTGKSQENNLTNNNQVKKPQSIINAYRGQVM